MCKNYNRIPVSVSLTIVYILLLTKCLRQTAPAGHGHTVGDTGRGHMVCAGLPQTGSLHHLPQEPEIWKKQKNIFTQLHWRSWQSAACESHLNRVLRPGPQVELQEAQVDQELQAQLFSPAQVRLVQVSSPSAQLQLLQSTWCVLPAAQLWPDASRQSHCHTWTHMPSCSSWPTHTTRDIFMHQISKTLLYAVRKHGFVTTPESL